MQHIDHAQIADAAYHLWLAEGRPEGRDHQHWLQARAALETKVAPKKRRAAAKPKAEAKAARPAAKKAVATATATAAAKPKDSAKPKARKTAK